MSASTGHLQERAKQFALYVALPVAAVLVTELVYRDDLFQKSLEEIPLMQEAKKVKSLFETTATLGS